MSIDGVTPAPSTVDRALFDEMVEALQWFVDNDDTMEGDDPMPEKGNLSWDEINAFWLAGLRRARAVLAKAREAGK